MLLCLSLYHQQNFLSFETPTLIYRQFASTRKVYLPNVQNTSFFLKFVIFFT